MRVGTEAFCYEPNGLPDRPDQILTRLDVDGRVRTQAFALGNITYAPARSPRLAE